jgi:hypothetical protein
MKVLIDKASMAFALQKQNVNKKYVVSCVGVASVSSSDNVKQQRINPSKFTTKRNQCQELFYLKKHGFFVFSQILIRTAFTRLSIVSPFQARLYKACRVFGCEGAFFKKSSANAATTGLKGC